MGTKSNKTSKAKSTEQKAPEKTWDERAEEIGSSAMSSIRDMVAALECDYDRLEELRDEAEGYEDAENQERTGRECWAEDNAEDAEELKSLEDDAGDCTSREDAEQIIQEDPLSLQFRSGWCASQEEMEPEEFELLLSTGGPAVRIIGEVRDDQAHRPRLEVQDWWKPWTEIITTGSDHDALETYCRCFYMGE